eukprot:CAMPEP_0117534268 /NCGR_PEP_ID=MMETSP0784-20121206/40321_1 /TAXON_ID=39447 /ORGANISM="" /LENGTH=423 /DNA_ID=CAMNT_0005330737 /DNA_START=44 /DNA_END=1315 /DNA_ORIENTATION=-
MAALTLASASVAPLAQPPNFARTPHELHAVLDAQAVEAKALRNRLLEGQRECGQLRRRLRDSTEEVRGASEAISTAAERLEVHQGRHGLVLAVGVERCSAERVAIEHELQRMERLLWDRDEEIKALASQARMLDAKRLQAELELTGLAVSHQAQNSEVRTLDAGVNELRQQLNGLAVGTGTATTSRPSPQHVMRAEETAHALVQKQDEHASLLHQAEAAATEARRLEAEGAAFEEHVRAFERSLRQKQDQMELHDRKLIHDAAQLREQCEHLRFILRDEQREATTTDQRAMLRGRCGDEADSVRRQVETTWASMRGLVMSLRERGRVVHSPEVPHDPLDAQLRNYLRCCGTPVDPAPPVVWRFAHGDYLIGESRVQIFDAGGTLMARVFSDHGHGPAAVPIPLRSFLQQQAHHAAASGRPIDV